MLQNNQLTDELEYQSKQTEKLLSKNQKLEENVSVLKRDVEIHKKVELELAQKSQKAQNEINNLSKQVKQAEKDKEVLAKDHNDSQQEYQEQINEAVDDKVLSLEKLLSKMHREVAILKKNKEKLDGEGSRISAKIKLLHENEHPCVSMLTDFLSNYEKASTTDKHNNDSHQNSTNITDMYYTITQELGEYSATFRQRLYTAMRKDTQ